MVAASFFGNFYYAGFDLPSFLGGLLLVMASFLATQADREYLTFQIVLIAWQLVLFGMCYALISAFEEFAYSGMGRYNPTMHALWRISRASILYRLLPTILLSTFPLYQLILRCLSSKWFPFWPRMFALSTLAVLVELLLISVYGTLQLSPNSSFDPLWNP